MLMIQYAKFISPKLNVALISKKTLGKANIQGAVLKDMDLLSTISYVLNDGAHQYTEHQKNVYNGVIPPQELNFSVIPNASIYIKADYYSRETKEHLTNHDNNLAILQNIINNKNRLAPLMVSKVEKIKNEIINKKEESINHPISKNINFAKRSPEEIKIANQIKQKNQLIKQQKAQEKQLDKPMVRTLNHYPNSNSTGNKGFTNVILIVSFLCGTILMIMYMLIKR